MTMSQRVDRWTAHQKCLICASMRNPPHHRCEDYYTEICPTAEIHTTEMKPRDVNMICPYCLRSCMHGITGTDTASCSCGRYWIKKKDRPSIIIPLKAAIQKAFHSRELTIKQIVMSQKTYVQLVEEVERDYVLYANDRLLREIPPGSVALFEGLPIIISPRVAQFLLAVEMA